jgi:deoxycytidylate deaminase
MAKHFDYCVSIARSADAQGFHFGAVIFNGSEVVSTGWCQCKSHPRQAHFMKYAKPYKQQNSWLHAEIHALVAAKRDCTNNDIVIARWAQGRLKNSFPCSACLQALSYGGIRKIWFWSEADSDWVFKYCTERN